MNNNNNNLLSSLNISGFTTLNNNTTLLSSLNFSGRTIFGNDMYNYSEVVKTHKDFTHFDLSYCIITHVSQGYTYDIPYSIYEYQYLDQALLHNSISRSTKKHL